MFLTFLNVFDFNMIFFLNYIYGCSADNNVDYYCTLNVGRGNSPWVASKPNIQIDYKKINVVLDCFMRNGVLSGGHFFSTGSALCWRLYRASVRIACRPRHYALANFQ